MPDAERGPDIAIVKLDEGWVLEYGESHTVALTNADDLAERVRTVALGLEDAGLLQVPEPEPLPPQEHVAAAVSEPDRPRSQPIPASGVVPTASLEQEWENVRKLIAFMAAGFDSNGRAFLRKDWDAAVPMFAPHVDPKEAEFELSEFLGSLHDDD